MENIRKTITMHANRQADAEDEPMINPEELLTEEEKEAEARMAAGDDIDMSPGKGKEKMQEYEEVLEAEQMRMEHDHEMHEGLPEGSSSSSFSDPEPDQESDDPTFEDAPGGSKRRISGTKEGSSSSKKTKPTPRKPAKRSAPRKKGSAKTRELERRLRTLEASMAKQGGSAQGAGPPTEGGWSAKKWSYKEYEAPLSGLKLCKTCFDEEDKQGEMLLNECWKHPCWDMVDKGNCETCGHMKHEIIFGVQNLIAAGLMQA